MNLTTSLPSGNVRPLWADVQKVKSAARGRWLDILTAIGGIGRDILDGRHHPCPKCGGTDRFRAFSDVNETGGAICNQCFVEDNGDGLATIGWLNDRTFSETLKAVSGHLGIEIHKQPVTPPDIVAEVARLKRMPLESFVAFGAKADKRGKIPVARVPMFDQDRKQCSCFDLSPASPALSKGLSAKGKPVGLFVASWPNPADEVLIPEGLKDAAASHGLGYLAVGLPGSKLSAKFARIFSGCHVIIIPDRDTTGEGAARVTAARLAGVAASVRIATLPSELKEKDGDGVREVLAMKDGETLLRQAIADAVAWQPVGGKSTEREDDKIIRNFELVSDDDGDESKAAPLPIVAISEIIKRLTDGWPRRVGPSLFVPHANRGVAWLPDTDAVFAYLGQATGQPPEFKAASGFHTKREFFAYLIRTATEYRAVEELPHEPPLAGHYYACDIPSSGSGERLNELVDRFSPETDIDRDLIWAAFVTPFWGGGGGTRPAFCITSDAGKGCGKSTLAASIGQLAGGALDVSANEDIGAIKSRLLSPEGITRRAIWIDNVKSHRLSWAELESLITSPVISGKRMYVGEGQRPNTLMFILTMNGVSLSTDMSQRCVVIKLRRPDYSGTWADETRQFIDQHRCELIADVLGVLRSPVGTLAKFSRWGDWERDILARLPEPSETQAVIRERQVGVDVDSEESALIEEYFAKQLSCFGYDTKSDRVFISSRVAARWFGWATDERMTVAKATRTLKQRITEGQLRRFMECGRRDIGRGFEFWGDDATGETYLKRDLEDLIRLRGENQVV